jgi:hypothetical protein
VPQSSTDAASPVNNGGGQAGSAVQQDAPLVVECVETFLTGSRRPAYAGRARPQAEPPRDSCLRPTARRPGHLRAQRRRKGRAGPDDGLAAGQRRGEPGNAGSASIQAASPGWRCREGRRARRRQSGPAPTLHGGARCSGAARAAKRALPTYPGRGPRRARPGGHGAERRAGRDLSRRRAAYGPLAMPDPNPGRTPSKARSTALIAPYPKGPEWYIPLTATLTATGVDNNALPWISADRVDYRSPAKTQPEGRRLPHVLCGGRWHTGPRA